MAVPGTSIRIEMVYVAAGGLRPFWISKREVTWGEFNRFYESRDEQKSDGITRPSVGREYVAASGLPTEFMEAEKPVTNLQYHSAAGYCEWLSRKTGLIFRLPTESEWELACGESSPEQAWFLKSSDERTHAPGEKRPNALGLYDMLGNVWEYCLESDHPPEFQPVLRGGAWNTPPTARRTIAPAEWYEADPSRPFSVWWFRADHSQGMRVVRVPESASTDDREAYGRKIEIASLRSLGERRIRIGTSTQLFERVSGEVRNAGDRALDELALKVYGLDPKGMPHLIDVSSNQARRATSNVAYPVLRNSAHPGTHASPLQPGERRAFTVDLPMTYDGPETVQPGRFGASVLHLRFSAD